MYIYQPGAPYLIVAWGKGQRWCLLPFVVSRTVTQYMAQLAAMYLRLSTSILEPTVLCHMIRAITPITDNCFRCILLVLFNHTTPSLLLLLQDLRDCASSWSSVRSYNLDEARRSCFTRSGNPAMKAHIIAWLGSLPNNIENLRNSTRYTISASDFLHQTFLSLTVVDRPRSLYQLYAKQCHSILNLYWIIYKQFPPFNPFDHQSNSRINRKSTLPSVMLITKQWPK